MRILQIAHGLYPYRKAGVEIYTHALSRELIKRGNDVLAAVPISRESEELVSAGIPVHPLPSAPYKTGADIPRYYRKLVWSSLYKSIDQFKPQIIHVQHLSHAGWEVLSQLQTLGIPFVVSLPDYWYLCRGIHRMCQGSALACAKICSNSYPQQPFRFFYEGYQAYRRRNRCVALLNRIAAPLVSISQRTADIHKQAGIMPGRIVVQPWGIDSWGLQAISSLAEDHPIRFGYVGTLSRVKGVDVLIRAFQRLSVPAALHVFGDGSPEFVTVLQDLAIGTSVQFHGAYDHRDIARILSRIDVVVVPSIWEEAYGLVVQEALAAGKIVIASAIGGLQDRILHGVNGFLCPPGDSDALARRMLEVAEHYQELVKHMAFDLCQQPLSTDGERFEDLYRWTMQNWTELNQSTVWPIEWEWKEIGEMLSSFLGLDKTAVHRKLKQEYQAPGSSVQEAWNKMLPKRDAEIEEFYRTTDCYLYDLVMVHRTSERRRWRTAAAALLAKYNIRTLLDYGGGCGDDCLLFSRLGIDCTLYDCGQLTAGFARFRAAQCGMKLEVVNELPVGRAYEGLYCTEVLEHVSQPLHEVAKMKELLHTGGILIVTHSFEAVGKDYPSHLERHRDMARIFVREVEKLGFSFEEVVTLPGNRFLVFRKLREKIHMDFRQLSELDQ